MRIGALMAGVMALATPANAETSLKLAGGFSLDAALSSVQPETAPEMALAPVLARSKKITPYVETVVHIQAPGDNSDFRGSTTTQRFAIDTGWVYNILENHEVTLGYRHESVFYHFKGAPSVFAGTDDPVDYLFKHEFHLGGLSQLSENIEANWGTEIILSMEPAADIEDSTYGRFYYAMRWQLNDSLKLGVGLAVQTRLEEPPLVYPYPYLEWMITDVLVLDVQEREARLNWLVRDDTTFSTMGRIRYDEYRIGDDNGALVDGILLDFGVELGGGIEIRPVPNAVISAEIGITQGRQIELQTPGGGQIITADVDPAGFFTFSLRYEF